MVRQSRWNFVGEVGCVIVGSRFVLAGEAAVPEKFFVIGKAGDAHFFSVSAGLFNSYRFARFVQSDSLLGLLDDGLVLSDGPRECALTLLFGGKSFKFSFE